MFRFNLLQDFITLTKISPKHNINTNIKKILDTFYETLNSYEKLEEYNYELDDKEIPGKTGDLITSYSFVLSISHAYIRERYFEYGNKVISIWESNLQQYTETYCDCYKRIVLKGNGFNDYTFNQLLPYIIEYKEGLYIKMFFNNGELQICLVEKPIVSHTKTPLMYIKDEKNSSLFVIVSNTRKLKKGVVKELKNKYGRSFNVGNNIILPCNEEAKNTLETMRKENISFSKYLALDDTDFMKYAMRYGDF